MPEYSHLSTVNLHSPGVNRPIGLEKWFRNTVANNNYNAANNPPPSDDALDLLKKLLEYDPLRRLTAEQALKHPYFVGEDGSGKPPSWNCFEGLGKGVSAPQSEYGGERDRYGILARNEEGWAAG